MAVLQDTFGEDIPVGYPGMEADGELSNIVTGTLEGDDNAPFGAPLFQGDDDRGVTLEVSSALIGFAIARTGLPVTADRPADHFAPSDNVPIKERGKIWVTSATAANRRQPVYITSGGAISSSSGGGNTAAPGWVFDDTIGAPGLVRIVRR